MALIDDLRNGHGYRISCEYDMDRPFTPRWYGLLLEGSTFRDSEAHHKRQGLELIKSWTQGNSDEFDS